MASSEFLAIILTGLGLIVTILYYTSVLHNANKIRKLQLKAQEQALETRRTQTFMQIYNESYNNPSFIDAYVRLADFDIQSYDEYLTIMEDEENKKASTNVAMFYEGIGVLVREGHISIRLFALLMTGMTQSWWERIYKPILEEGRAKRNFKRWMSESEYLYNELMKYHEEKLTN
jgi:hypothetical protein